MSARNSLLLRTHPVRIPHARCWQDSLTSHTSALQHANSDNLTALIDSKKVEIIFRHSPQTKQLPLKAATEDV
ncbi:hypothetical protein KK060_07610 [Fulvivirgaceae bacterium PWU20]|uniref:Uncharacterized protein n=1 Tax=Chryseosolibacter indicus TaxID=2782351 RepID=A0ABS5VT21_9BACT|nr:hypothetical protein [Chryseosolibacter indicus]